MSRTVTKWLEHAEGKTLSVSLDSLCENGYVESFNERLRGELLNRELFLHIDELKYVFDHWRMGYSHYRLHSFLGYRSPAAFAAMCAPPGSAPPRLPGHKYQDMDTLITDGT